MRTSVPLGRRGTGETRYSICTGRSVNMKNVRTGKRSPDPLLSRSCPAFSLSYSFHSVVYGASVSWHSVSASGSAVSCSDFVVASEAKEGSKGKREGKKILRGRFCGTRPSGSQARGEDDEPTYHTAYSVPRSSASLRDPAYAGPEMNPGGLRDVKSGLACL